MRFRELAKGRHRGSPKVYVRCTCLEQSRQMRPLEADCVRHAILRGGRAGVRWPMRLHGSDLPISPASLADTHIGNRCPHASTMTSPSPCASAQNVMYAGFSSGRFKNTDEEHQKRDRGVHGSSPQLSCVVAPEVPRIMVTRTVPIIVCPSLDCALWLPALDAAQLYFGSSQGVPVRVDQVSSKFQGRI
jgi:hypothetical protein